MSRSTLCGVHLGAGLVLVVMVLVDRALASLDGYIPGQDYPAFEEVPQGLGFTCADKIPGYYADPSTRCQVWHWCVPTLGGNTIFSFICAPGTVFDQRTRVCDYFYKVDCPSSEAFYGINEDLYKDEAGNYIAGKKKDDTNAITKYDERRQEARRKRHNTSRNSTQSSSSRQSRQSRGNSRHNSQSRLN